MSRSRHPRIATLLPCLLLIACGASDAPAADAGDEPGAMNAGTAVGNPGGEGGATTLGTIQATVDGRAMTWYVVSGTIEGHPYASGAWLGEPGESMVIVGGYDTPTPPLDSFRRQPDGSSVSYGDYDGSVFAVVVSEAAGTPPVTVGITVPYPVAPTHVYGYYQPRAGTENLMETIYWLSDGEVEITSLAIEGERARTSGTFSGTFVRSDGAGARFRITNGRFEVRDLPNVSVISP